MIIDVKQAYRELAFDQELVHVARAKANISILRASTIPFTVEPSGLVKVRCQGYPAIEFDCGQGRWTVGNRTMMGSAESLIDFLKVRAMK